MLTNGLEEREFLYVEDCCEALEKIMINYEEFNSNDDLHITSFKSTTILEIASIIESLFRKEGLSVNIKPGVEQDQVQRSKKNRHSQYITKWWTPRTSIHEGIRYVFDYMKSNY